MKKWKRKWFKKAGYKKLTAKFSAIPQNPFNSRWVFYGDGKILFMASLGQIWGPEFNKNTAKASTTKEYAKRIMKRIRQDGRLYMEWLLTGRNVNWEE